ncbi:aminopeptidase P N-terminal domain-containing protein [Myxococcota bacterium]|nr:aminopeptidase P N-terminal domain-containing protein [Myxococcota bacterium]MBU1432549.1 aminopeptidase P N-terminal domain-containing protein [Myxococcota bacterium]MBU1898838.1 aminopeptidase P N-terminal domain-containing protein [Myxococcota bacterium]
MEFREVTARRRALVIEALEGRRALIPAGRPHARNYPANRYPFRASSHFLYLVGCAAPGAFLYLDRGGEATLFIEPQAPGDAMWHGPAPSFAAWASRTGIVTRPLDALRQALDGPTATLPAMDCATRAEQAQLLERPIDLNRLDPIDEPLADALIQARLIHDKAAIRQLRAAAAVTSEAHRAAMRVTRPGLNAWAIRASVEATMTRWGMGTAFPTIATTRGEILHNEGYDDPLRAGDLLLLDAGAEGPEGWAGDVSRTWPVSGRFSGPQRDLYTVVLNAQAAALALAHPGVRYRDVHMEAAAALLAGLVALGIFKGDVQELLADDAHALFFPHGVGHLLGLDVHDMEDLGDRAGYAPGWSRSTRFGLSALRLDRVLEPGMAITIEPGFYQAPAIVNHPEIRARVGDRLRLDVLARYQDVRGIRVEDDVLITPQGAEILTNAPKTLRGIEAIVGAGEEAR